MDDLRYSLPVAFDPAATAVAPEHAFIRDYLRMNSGELVSSIPGSETTISFVGGGSYESYVVYPFYSLSLPIRSEK